MSGAVQKGKRECELQQARGMKAEKNTVEEAESKTTGKVFLGKSKNGPRDDKH